MKARAWRGWLPSRNVSVGKSVEAGPTPVVWSGRTDGLGERLCSILNSKLLAETIGWEFSFGWKDSNWLHDYRALENSVIGKIAVTNDFPAEEVFSSSFLRDFHKPKRPDGNFLPVQQMSSVADLESARRQEGFAGLITGQQLILEEIRRLGSGAGSPLSYPQVFRTIGFSDKYRRLQKLARDAALPKNFIAIHLRSGDMVYGEPRKWGIWAKKVLVPAVASDYIQRLTSMGFEVVVFAQNKEVSEILAASPRVYSSTSFLPGVLLSNTELAFFEMMMMSRSVAIISGASGFSRFAAMAGGISFIEPNKELSPNTLLSLVEADSDREHRWDTFLSAYSWYQAYKLNEQSLTGLEGISLLENATELDPRNNLYSVLLSALHYRIGNYTTADTIILDSQQMEGADSIEQSEFLHLLLHQHPGNPPSLSGYFQDFVDASCHSDLAKFCGSRIIDRFPDWPLSIPRDGGD